MIVELPNDVDEYRLLFEGEYNKTTYYWRRNFVTIDNLELRSCSYKGNLLRLIRYHLQNKLCASFFTTVICYPNIPQNLKESNISSRLFAQLVDVSGNPQI